MNNNAIKISPILGTDSLSSSRIVINDNFKILANVLENYQEYFNENGVYSSTIISKNEEGTIDFKTDETHTVMELSSEGIDINGSLVIHGSLTVEDKGETVFVQNVLEFQTTVEEGYVSCYNKGCYITPYDGISILSISKLEKLLLDEPTTLIQYINSPFIFCGKGVRILLDDPSFTQRIITNGKIETGEDGYYLIDSKYERYEEALNAITVIRIYPVVNDILGDSVAMLNFEFSSSVQN